MQVRLRDQGLLAEAQSWIQTQPKVLASGLITHLCIVTHFHLACVIRVALVSLQKTVKSEGHCGLCVYMYLILLAHIQNVPSAISWLCTQNHREGKLALLAVSFFCLRKLEEGSRYHRPAFSLTSLQELGPFKSFDP